MKFLVHLDPFVDLQLSFGIAVAYIALGVAGNHFMANKKALELRALKFIYNLSQIIICAVVFLKLLPFFLAEDSYYGLMIVPNATVEWWVFVYYVCKLLDFCDTIFMVLGKKTRQFTVLHVWHHASIVPLFGYYLSAGLGAGSICALPLLNSLVHVVMYTHFLVTSVFTFKNMWWKPIVTSVQMGHHVVLIAMMARCGVTGNPEWTFRMAASGILWGVSILGLFLKFYIDEYLNHKKK